MKIVEKNDLFSEKQTIFVTPEDYEKMIEEQQNGI